MTVPVVTIFGGSGFIGRQVAQRMARAGWRVRVAVRRPEQAGFVRPYGFVGQVEPIQANIRDESSTRRGHCRRRCGGELRRDPRRGRAADLRGRARRGRGAYRPALRRGRGGAPRARIGYRRRSRQREPLRRRQGAWRGGGRGAVSRRDDHPTVDRFRRRRRLLQPAGMDRADLAGHADRRARHSVPAGLCR